MSTTQIYWLTRIPDITQFFITIPGAIAAIVFFISICLLILVYIDKKLNIGVTSETDDTDLQICRKASSISGIVMLVLMFIDAFIPSKQDMHLMIAKQLATQDGVVVNIAK